MREVLTAAASAGPGAEPLHTTSMRGTQPLPLAGSLAAARAAEQLARDAAAQAGGASAHPAVRAELADGDAHARRAIGAPPPL
eukprot:244537-Chlamydomonas_euryale.AAC.1